MFFLSFLFPTFSPHFLMFNLCLLLRLLPPLFITKIQYICLRIYLFMHLFIYWFTYLCIHLFILLFILFFIYLFYYLFYFSYFIQINDRVLQNILVAATLPSYGLRSIEKYIEKRFPLVSLLTNITQWFITCCIFSDAVISTIILFDYVAIESRVAFYIYNRDAKVWYV